MRRSLQIGSVAGIGIFLHWTFGLLVLGVPAFYLWQGATPRAALAGTAVVGVVFVCVLLHELGHALTARRFDVPTRDITLYPIGGIARLQEIPEEAIKEFWIAVAGPAVNAALAAALAALVAALGLSFTSAALFDPAGMPAGSVPATLLWINVALAVFNMLPAFPMDGGRVLRALLATRFSYARATQLAANVGQAMALGFAGLGLFGGNVVLIFIAIFVYLGAQQEARQATLRQATQGLRVRQAMMTRFQTLAPTDPLGEGADALIAGTDHDFPVVRWEDGAVVGLLRRQRLIEALSEQGREGGPVGEVARQDDVLTAEAEENLDDVFQRMRGRSISTVPVTEEGRLVGLLTMENVAELMMISSALGEEAIPERTAGGDSAVEALPHQA
jgi:Zn-dependent protease/CBS domain-containing protein